VTNASGGVVSENVGLPYGNTIQGESLNLNQSDSKRRFTSYDRSTITKLDYAVNRHYSPAQGRFTQVDPIEMDAADIADPQSLNLYAYCANDPVNHTDPDGLFFKKFFKGLLKVATFGIWAFKPVRQAVIKVLANKWVQLAIGVVLAILAPPAGVIIVNLVAGSEAAIAALATTRYILMGLQAAGAVSSFAQQEKAKRRNSDKAIATAIDSVAQILSGDNPCSKFFGKHAAEVLEDLGARATYGMLTPRSSTVGIHQSGQQTVVTNSQTGARYRRFKSVIVNVDGPFYRKAGTSSPGGYDPGTAQSRALQILHELAHAIPKGDGYLIEDDGGDTEKSKSNTAEVLKHCKAEIDKIQNK
jgi:RHS repeat-associated protein